jgi:putative ribosome biogenesis GTPase RsgA
MPGLEWCNGDKNCKYFLGKSGVGRPGTVTDITAKLQGEIQVYRERGRATSESVSFKMRSCR